MLSQVGKKFVFMPLLPTMLMKSAGPSPLWAITTCLPWGRKHHCPSSLTPSHVQAEMSSSSLLLPGWALTNPGLGSPHAQTPKLSTNTSTIWPPSPKYLSQAPTSSTSCIILVLLINWGGIYPVWPPFLKTGTPELRGAKFLIHMQTPLHDRSL